MIENGLSEIDYKSEFAHRVKQLPESFIREILKVTTRPDIISFAGGLPNPDFFPVEEIAKAADAVLTEDGRQVLQYTITEGFRPLKEQISARYEAKGLQISPENILILSGSQQGLDLVGKLLLNPGDGLLLEKPTFIGAMQSFSIFQPNILEVPLSPDGPDLGVMESSLQLAPKIFYCVPNFQNPTGATYSHEKRKRIAELIAGSNTMLVEDDPYGDIIFEGGPHTSFMELIPDHTILFGSFSKTIAPGLRTGWIAAPSKIIRELVLLKQAADTHTNHLSQRIISRFINDNNFDGHIAKITTAYRRQRDCMVKAINEHFPGAVEINIPSGGMFLWATLPGHFSAYDIFDAAIEQKVAFVPAKTFYPNLDVDNTFRLNFSNCNEEQIKEGIKRLGNTLSNFL